MIKRAHTHTHTLRVYCTYKFASTAVNSGCLKQVFSKGNSLEAKFVGSSASTIIQSTNRGEYCSTLPPHMQVCAHMSGGIWP